MESGSVGMMNSDEFDFRHYFSPNLSKAMCHLWFFLFIIAL